MKLNMPVSIASNQDLSALILEMKEYARWFAHDSIKRQVGATKSSETPPLSIAARAIIGQSKLNKNLSRLNFDTVIDELHEYQASATSISISLSAPVTNKLKLSLVTWCRDNISPNILVNFNFNATILGGMVVKSGSRIYDWSFRRHILQSRNNFPEVLRRV